MKSKLILCIFAFLILAFFIGGCGCGDDDDDDDSGTTDDDDDDTTDDDDTGDDDDDDNPFGDIPIDQTFSFPNLSGPVEVIITEYGIPHIYAENEDDLMFVFGYITSMYRFWQMDFLRHLTTGRLTEYLYPVGGDDVLQADLAMRTRFMSTNGELVFHRIVDELLTEDEKAMWQKYADGINAYISDIQTGANGMTPPEQYIGTLSLIGVAGVTVDDIPEWTLYDTFAIVRYQQWDLSSSLSSELRNGLSYAALPADVLADTLRFAPVEDTSILPGFYDSKGKSESPGPYAASDFYQGLNLERLQTAFNNLPEDAKDHLINLDRGSNNWVVHSSKTTSGNSILANDTHLSLTNPAIFFEIQIDTKVFGDGDDVYSAYGQNFPGIPGLPIGMNENIAWGATMAGYDVEDVYLETLDNADLSLATSATFEGSQVDIEYSEQVFKLGPGEDAATQTLEIPYLPHHGPFLYGSVEDSGGMTNKWTGHEPTNDLPAFVGLLHAKDVDDFMESMPQFLVGAQNFVAIDVDGNIAYYPHAQVPIRESGKDTVPPWVPMPGEGDYEWTGYIPDEDLPQIKNPEWGYVVTANNDMVGNLTDNDPLNDEFYLFWDRLGGGFRSHRITELMDEMLASKGTVTVDDMKTIQADTYSSEASRFLSYLSTAADNEPTMVTDLGLGDAIDILEAWDFSTPTGLDSKATKDEVDNSIATSIFYAFWTRMVYNSFADEFDEDGCIGYDAPLPRRDALYYLLDNPTTSQTGDDLFDNCEGGDTEGRDDVLLNTLADALAWLESEDGFDSANMDDWTWGTIHQTQWEDFFAAFDESFATIKGPYPIDGADQTVDAAGSSGFKGLDGDDNPVYSFINTHGPTIRFFVEATQDGMVAYNAIPGGEACESTSEHYNDQAEIFINNNPHPVMFSLTDVSEGATGRMVFEP